MSHVKSTINAESLTTTATLKGTVNINTTGTASATINASTTNATTTANQIGINNTTNSTTTTITSSASASTWVLPSGQGASGQTVRYNSSGSTWVPVVAPGTQGCQVIIYADKINAQASNASVTTNTANSLVNIYTVYVGSSNMTPGTANGTSTPYTGWTMPTTGIYEIALSMFGNSSTNGNARLTVTRSSTVVFDQVIQGKYPQTDLIRVYWVWHGFQAGDSCQLFANEVITGYGPTSLSDGSSIKQKGELVVRYLVTHP